MTTTTPFGQIRFASDQGQANNLAIHLIRPDGETGCGDTLRPWKGQTAVLVAVDPTKCPDSIGLCRRNGCFPL